MEHRSDCEQLIADLVENHFGIEKHLKGCTYLKEAIEIAVQNPIVSMMKLYELVGVLAADLSLNISDYRASERTFQLLTQAAGRAGRGEKPGEAIIQTYQPEHYSIQAAMHQDYRAFYEEEIGYRKLLGYPPVSNLLAIHGSCGNEELLETGMQYIKKFLNRVDSHGQLQIIGPADETVSKIADMYRKVIYIKQEDHQLLLRAKSRLEQYIEVNSGFREIRIQLDFNH